MCPCGEDSLYECKCGIAYCVICGVEQGDFINGKYDGCGECFVQKTIESLPYPRGWEEFFDDNKKELSKISKFVENVQETVYPPIENVFRIFELCKPSDIKVVIMGQDPYHGVGQAMGMSFSVQPGIKPPPSLINIFKELESDGFSVENKENGDLTTWAKQGVFLLNAALTVVESKAGSHQKIWKSFTDQVINYINFNCENVIFILWGRPAQRCQNLLSKNHEIIESAHPSPLSAFGGFFGSKPFSRANNFLRQYGKSEIDWSL